MELPFNPDKMPEGTEPIITVETELIRAELPRSRTTVYTFLGKSALDHIFLFKEEKEDGTRSGFPIFREDIPNNEFDSAIQAALMCKFNMILNAPEVPDTDLEMYVASRVKMAELSMEKLLNGGFEKPSGDE